MRKLVKLKLHSMDDKVCPWCIAFEGETDEEILKAAQESAEEENNSHQYVHAVVEKILSQDEAWEWFKFIVAHTNISGVELVDEALQELMKCYKD